MDPYRQPPGGALRCGKHAAAFAIGSCRRCGAPVCAPCSLYDGLALVCSRCELAARRRRRWRRVVALGVFLGVTLDAVMVTRMFCDRYEVFPAASDEAVVPLRLASNEVGLPTALPRPRTNDALSDLDVLIRFSPEDAALYLERGALHERRGEESPAIADYLKATELLRSNTSAPERIRRALEPEPDGL